MKRLTFTRTSWITSEEITKKELDSLFKIHRWNEVDPKKARATTKFFRSATFLTYQQYIDLVHKRPYLSEQLQFLRLSWEKAIEWLIIITDKTTIINPFKILHTYISNCNLIKIHQAVQWDYFFFDQNISFEFKDFLGSIKYIKPDAIIMKGEKIIILETDLWTESFKKLEDKSNAYREYLSWIKNRDNYQLNDVKILFFTTTERRIYRMRQQKIFQWLEELHLIRYWLNDTW